MQISVDKKLFEKFPGFHLGILFLKGVSNKGADSRLNMLLENTEKLLQLDSTGMLIKRSAEVFAGNLVSPEKAVYEDTGFKPVHYKTNVEEMMKTILEGKKLKSSTKLDDCVRYVSLKFIAPIGVFDSERINGDVVLKLKSQNVSDVVLSDNDGVFSEGWNLQTAQRARVSEKTSSAIVFIDGISPLSKENVIEILHELREVCGMFCGTVGKEAVLSVVKGKIDIPV